MRVSQHRVLFAVAVTLFSCLVAAIGLASFGATRQNPALVQARQLTEAEMNRVYGSAHYPAYAIFPYPYYTECFRDPINMQNSINFANDCDFKSCMGGDTDCGTGTRYGATQIQSATYVSGPSVKNWLEFIPTFCYQPGIPCVTAALQTSKDCDQGSGSHVPGGCVPPNQGTQPTGCRPCSAGVPGPYTPPAVLRNQVKEHVDPNEE
jgi:hypothetical protein